MIDQPTRVTEVLEARTQTGREDLVLLVAAATISDIQRIAIDLVNILGVRHTDTSWWSTR